MESRRIAGTLEDRTRKTPTPYVLLRRKMRELQKGFGLSVDQAEREMTRLIDAGGLGDPKTLKPLLPNVAEDMRDQTAEDD